MISPKGLLGVDNTRKPEEIKIDTNWKTEFLWHNTLCIDCNDNIKTLSIDWGWECNVAYEIKGAWKNKYIEVLWIQVQINATTNPFILQDEVWNFLNQVLWDVNESQQDKINISEFTLLEITSRWDNILTSICREESLDIRTKIYFKKASGWYMQFNKNYDR